MKINLYRILFFILLITLYSCEKSEETIVETSVTDYEDTRSTYYILMSIEVENKRISELNKINKKFDLIISESNEMYVSDVVEINSNLPIVEDKKYRMLDNFEKDLLKQLGRDYVVINRYFDIYDTYAEASMNR